MAEISQITLPSGSTYDIKDVTARDMPSAYYGTCSTAAATAAKVVEVANEQGFTLKAGALIGVKFTNTNTASNVTLNVNSTGAKSIWYNNAAYTGNANTITGYANRLLFYMYDGTNWCLVNKGWVDDNNTYTAASAAPLMDGTAAVGSSAKYAREDHVHPSDSTKVDKVSGKGLSTNDFTDALESKLTGIAAGAEVNVQSDWNVTDSSSDAFIKNKPNAYVRGEYIPYTGITNPYYVKMFGNKRYTDYFQTIKAFAGEGDYLYCADLNSAYTITCSKPIGGSYGDYKSIFNHNMSDTLLVRTSDLPFTIEVAKNGNIDATDVTYIMFLSHTLGSNGKLKDYKIEIFVTSKSSTSSLTTNAWNTVVDRTNVSDDINGLIHHLHQTSGGGFAYFSKVRVTITGIIPASTVSTAWNYDAVAITSMQIVNSRPGFTAAAGLGALDIRGGTVYGPTTFANGITSDVNGKINNHTVNSDVPANAKFTDTTYTAGTNVQISNNVISATNTMRDPASATPLMDGTAAVGSSAKYAREDHVHPSDTTKVDKVTGKGLSTNDFTDALETKLNGIAAGAEVNVQSDWNESDTASDAYIKNKPTIPTIPANIVTDANYVHTDNNFTTTEKNKLSGIATGAEANVQSDWNVTDTSSDAFIKNKPTIPTVPGAASTAPKMDGTAAVGTSAKYARQDHVHPSDTSRVPTTRTINGKALSSNITLSASDVGALDSSSSLDATKLTGMVPTASLPSYVDDVLEYTNKASFPATGQTGKIYVDKATNLTYRWSGSAYVQISPSLALGTTSSTAYRGDYGNTAYKHATDSSRLTTATSSGLYKVAATAQGHIASLTAVTKADITALGIPGTDTNTDTKVTQTNTTTNADYRVLFSENANDTTQDAGARKNTNFKYNPSTGNVNLPNLIASGKVTVGSHAVLEYNASTASLDFSFI